MVVVWANLQNCSIFSLVCSMLHIFSILTRRVCPYFIWAIHLSLLFLQPLSDWVICRCKYLHQALSSLSSPECWRCDPGDDGLTTDPWPHLACVLCGAMSSVQGTPALLSSLFTCVLSLLNVFWVFHVTLRFQILKVKKLGAWLNPVSNLVSVYFSSERKLRIMIEIEVCTERVTISNFISLIDNKCSW